MCACVRVLVLRSFEIALGEGGLSTFATGTDRFDEAQDEGKAGKHVAFLNGGVKS